MSPCELLGSLQRLRGDGLYVLQVPGSAAARSTPRGRGAGRRGRPYSHPAAQRGPAQLDPQERSEGPESWERRVWPRRRAQARPTPTHRPPPAPIGPVPAAWAQRTCQQRRGGRHLGRSGARLPLPGERRRGRPRDVHVAPGLEGGGRRHVTRGRGPGLATEYPGPAPRAVRISGGRCRAVLTLAASGGSGGGPGAAWSHHGGQAAHPYGQREAQQEHHAARERRQNLEDGPGGEGVGWALAAGVVHFRGLRISHLPDHPEHPDGHVRGLSPGQAHPCPSPVLP